MSAREMFAEAGQLPLFLCWEEDEGDREDAKEVRSRSADIAAERFAERRYSESDYPELQRVCVIDEQGKLWKFSVYAEPSVDFKAHPR